MVIGTAFMLKLYLESSFRVRSVSVEGDLKMSGNDYLTNYITRPFKN